MKFYGYEGDSALLELSEVTIQASSEELRNIAGFIIKCADEMEKYKNWEHEHYCDYTGSSKCNVDLIISR